MLFALALQQMPQSLQLQKAIYVLALRIHLKITIIIMSKEALNMARIAEQTERYDDMVRYIKESIRMHHNQKGNYEKWVGEQQMKLLGTAYKCKINSRRTAWRALSIFYAKEANSKNRSAAIIQLYKDSIEKEIREIAQDAISTLDTLVKNLSTPALRLQFWKMKGDLQRYLCQIAKDTQQLKRLQKETEISYSNGVQQARENQKKQNNQNQKNKGSIETYDSRRLAIFLNLSVFYYEIVGSVSKAIETCQQGFSSALEKIGDLQEAKYIDTVTIMQLMHDNITAWRSQKDQKK